MELITASEILRQHPSVQALSGQRFLIKYGGAAMEIEQTRQLVCSEIAALSNLGVKIIVVHGGGKEISRMIDRLGLTSHFIDGLRVTDDAAMLATEMVLSGTVNSDLISRITRSGAPAVGVSGRAARLITAQKLRGRTGEDLGRTGEVVATDPAIIEALLAASFVPVISPVGEDSAGNALNLNADYAAGALAGALGAKACVFLTDVAGVRHNGAVVASLTREEIATLIHDGVISGGMIPKVECALRALAAGCPRAVIADAAKPLIVTSAILDLAGCGTNIT